MIVDCKGGLSLKSKTESFEKFAATSRDKSPEVDGIAHAPFNTL
jgi:hypothetical protein